MACSRKRASFWKICLGATLGSSVAATCLAQVSIDPLITSPGSWERFAIRVANQWEPTITAVSVRVPDAVTILGVEQRPGWTFTLQEPTDTSPASITWRGGSLSHKEFLEFALLGRVAGDARRTDLVFPVTLTQSDGQTLEWSNAPGWPRPAPRVRIVGTTQLSPWGALALAGAAFVTAVLALILAFTRRKGAV